MNKENFKSGLFKFSMWWRIFYGTTRLFLGFAFLMVVDVPLSELLYKFSGSDLVENSSDFLFVTVNSLLESYPLSVTYFLAAYLIFWGTIEIVLSVSLLQHRIWSFPITLWLIAFFMIYVIYRYTQTHSPILIGVFLVDCIIFYLIQNEYKKLKTSPDYSLVVSQK